MGSDALILSLFEGSSEVPVVASVYKQRVAYGGIGVTTSSTIHEYPKRSMPLPCRIKYLPCLVAANL